MRGIALFLVMTLAAGCTAAPPPSPVASATPGLPDRVEAYVSHLHGLGFVGSTLVAVDGERIHSGGAGLAQRDPGVAYSVDTVVPIGSITKLFTAAAILSLEVDGLLSRTDAVGTFFPGAPPEVASITIRQLLDHRSGLPEYSGPDDELRTRDAFLDWVRNARPLFAPGTDRAYSNPGFTLLAAIIEEVAGADLETFLRARFFDGAGMTQTGLALPDWTGAQLAHAYAADGRDLGTMLDLPRDGTRLTWNLHGNGGFLSTPRDLLRWSVALGDPTIVPPPVLAGLREHFVPPGGAGIALVGGDDFSQAAFVRLDSGVMAFAATNLGDAAAGIARELARLADGQDIDERPTDLPSLPG